MTQETKPRKRSILPLMIVALGAVLLVVAIVWIRSSGTPASDAPTATIELVTGSYEIPRIRVADAKTLLDRGQAVLLDVRSASAYAASHIPGAISIPLSELESRLDELDPQSWIITYCT